MKDHQIERNLLDAMANPLVPDLSEEIERDGSVYRLKNIADFKVGDILHVPQPLGPGDYPIVSIGKTKSAYTILVVEIDNERCFFRGQYPTVYYEKIR